MSSRRQRRSMSLTGRLRRRVLPVLARVTALLGLAIAIAWITGRVLSDQHLWSQYLWWIPPIWMLGSAWVLLGVSALLAIPSRRSGGLMARPVLLLLNTGCTLFLVFGIWRAHRVLGSDARAPGSIRVVHWNQAGVLVDQTAFAKGVFDAGADIVLVSNAVWGDERQRLLDALAPFAPSERQRWINYSYKVHADPAHFRIEDGAFIASRFPMIRTGKVEFGSAERQQMLSYSSSGRGWVMFIELDTSPDDPGDAPMVVWFVDMPSNPARSRQSVMTEARAAIDAWDGSGWAMGKHVWEQTQQEHPSFPDPDLIIGDFNTPRGSDSLRLLEPGMHDAFAQAGCGRAGSWTPEGERPPLSTLLKLADWHIDLSLVGSRWEATRYELVRPGKGPHAMQVVDMVARGI